MKIKVTVDGYGAFQIENDKIPQLLNWLSQNEGVYIRKEPIREVKDDKFTGNVLIEENDGNKI